MTGSNSTSSSPIPRRAVVALGGHALADHGDADPDDLPRQLGRFLARCAARGAALAVTHGNGPQVGRLALRGAEHGADPGLDRLTALTQAQLGYRLLRALDAGESSGVQVSALLTRVEVASAQAVESCKPVGPAVSAGRGGELGERLGWEFAETPAGRQRVVPSPEPLRILEGPAIRRLLQPGALVICLGGGGIPVQASPDSGWDGSDVVVDKDLSSCLLAEQVGAELLVLATDVRHVYENWGTGRERAIHTIRPSALDPASFTAGSMGPKVTAACRFVTRCHRPAVIGSIDELDGLLQGSHGTRILPEGRPA